MNHFGYIGIVNKHMPIPTFLCRIYHHSQFQHFAAQTASAVYC